jgi:hypothetical protein
VAPTASQEAHGGGCGEKAEVEAAAEVEDGEKDEKEAEENEENDAEKVGQVAASASGGQCCKKSSKPS